MQISISNKVPLIVIVFTVCSFVIADEKSKAITCYSCNSKDDENCVKPPRNTTEITCKESAECYTHIKDGIISRGCIGDSIVPSNEDCSNPNTCKKCSTRANCNDERIEKEHCIVCNSQTDEKCRTEATYASNTLCPLTITPMGCYHRHNSSTNVVERGCTSQFSDSELIDCQTNDIQCKICLNGDNCNSRKSFEKCFNCSSLNNKNCLALHGSIEVKVCAAYNDQCFTYINGSEVVRGCLEESTFNLTSELYKYKKTVELCSSEGEKVCNNQDVTVDTCVACDSWSNPKCIDPSAHPELVDSGKICSFGRNESAGCYLQLNGAYRNRYIRGCVQDYINAYHIPSMKQSDSTKRCIGKNCNKKRGFQKCYECKGKLETCTHIDNTSNFTVCTDYYSSCFTGIDKSGWTHRGCTTDFDIVSDIELSATCDGNFCNNGIYPYSRLTCYQSEDDYNLASDEYYNHNLYPLWPCKLYSSKLDECYTYFGENKIHRGCASDSSEIRMLCDRFPWRCKKCSSNGCNKHMKNGKERTKQTPSPSKLPTIVTVTTQNPTTISTTTTERQTFIESDKKFLKCYTCNSSIDGICQFHDKLKSAKLCNAHDDKCFTLIRGNHVQRGCLKELNKENTEICGEKSPKCGICSTEACNNHNVFVDTCIQCTSEIDSKCIDQPELFKESSCSVGKNQTTGCYLHVRSGAYRRGCINELNFVFNKLCWENKNSCKSCVGKNCNTKVDFQKCHVCEGKNDSNCTEITDKNNATACDDYFSSCVTGLDDDGYIFRRCANSYDNNYTQTPNKIDICTESECNNKIFPEHRLQCYQCREGEACEQLTTNSTEPINPSPCNRFSEYDQCYTYFTADEKVYRGCLSDSTDNRLQCDADDVLCKKCKGNGCNDQKTLGNESETITESSDGEKPTVNSSGCSMNHISAGIFLTIISALFQFIKY